VQDAPSLTRRSASVARAWAPRHLRFWPPPLRSPASRSVRLRSPRHARWTHRSHLRAARIWRHDRLLVSTGVGLVQFVARHVRMSSATPRHDDGRRIAHLHL